MIQAFLIALLVMVLVTAAAVIAAVIQGKRAKKAETENSALREAFRQVQDKAERLQKVIGDSVKAEEAANAEKKELAQTPDSGLADRANSLFDQLQDPANPKRGS